MVENISTFTERLSISPGKSQSNIVTLETDLKNIL